MWRAIVACMACFQMGAMAVLTHAESIQDAERIGFPVHVESPGNTDCNPHHGHLFCNALLLVLVEGKRELGRVKWIGSGIRSPIDLFADVFSPASTRLAGSVIPRAPPRV